MASTASSLDGPKRFDKSLDVPKMDIIELVLDRLVNVNDVVPFLSVSHRSKFLAQRRICEIFLETSLGEVGDEPCSLLVNSSWSKGRMVSFVEENFAVMAKEVISCDRNWKVRFHNSYRAVMTIPAPPSTNVYLSIRTPSSFERERIWLGYCNDFNIDMFEFALDRMVINESGCGMNTRSSNSELSICYEVSRGHANDVLDNISRSNTFEWSDEEVDEGDQEVELPMVHWDRFAHLRCELLEQGETELLAYHIKYLDVPVTLLLEVWRDWKSPIKEFHEYIHHRFGTSTHMGGSWSQLADEESNHSYDSWRVDPD